MIVASGVLVRLLVLAAERLLNSDSLLESSLFDSCKQAVSFCTEEIRSSIGKSHELSSLFALLLCFASGLPIQRYRRDQRQQANAEKASEFLRDHGRQAQQSREQCRRQRPTLEKPLQGSRPWGLR